MSLSITSKLKRFRFSFKLPFKLPSVSPIARIALGLVSVSLSLILGFDMVFGLFPRETETARQIRQKISQNLAIQTTALIESRDFINIDRVFSSILAKDVDMQSIGIRRSNGDIIVASSEHIRLWSPSVDGGSTLEQVVVPLHAQSKRWGTLELVFRPPGARTIVDWLTSPPMKLFFSFLFGGGLMFYFFLRRVLQKMDPASSVPDRVRMAFDTLSEGIIILDANSRAIMVNRSIRTMTGASNEQLIGKDAQTFKWLRVQNGENDSPWRTATKTKTTVLGTSFYLQGVKGAAKTVVVNCAPILDAKQTVRGCMVTFNDISALEQAREQLMEVLADLASSKQQLESQNGDLERLASRDSLTGCLNRRAFFERYEKLFAQAKRNNLQLTCIMADIDKFKTINDTLGHGVGDKVIIEFSKILQDAVRGSDLVGRYGGEEFCIVLTGADVKSAQQLADRIRANVESSCAKAAAITQFNVTASFGVSSIVFGAKTPAALVDESDQALYIAKQSGRNRVANYGDLAEVTV
jgi:diguanylate cyclase (GGDEF)-like protein/PAS domain S-box-containing protein